MTVSHDAIWESESLPAKAKPTGWFHHTFASGGRLGVAPVITGGVRSIRSVTVPVVVPELSELSTVQEKLLSPSFLYARRVGQLSGKPVVSHLRLTGWLCQDWQSVGVKGVGEKHLGVTLSA